ncbi:MAG: NAD(P)-binding domain-containing protein [Candidatus Krumholzibacteriia bacterium]
MTFNSSWLAVIAPLLVLAVVSLARQMKRRQAARSALAQAREAGLDEPLSLHPVVDPTRCLGCASCIDACPEHGVLQIVDGRTHLVDASHCVGHGRCKDACPADALELVFGTPKRPMQVPVLDDALQSGVPGLYVAGELGGLGLIRNALTQGLRAVEALSAGLSPSKEADVLDVAIVGAGPAGIAAALACRERGLRHLILDQEGLGGSVNHYPRQKLVMTSPIKLPVVGRMYFREVHKEDLLKFWEQVVARGRLELNAPARVVDVQRNCKSFIIETSAGQVRAQRVVLATGRRGTPRKLGVPGEDCSKVAYRLLEPDRYRDQDVLVVGGGNSAVEAANSLAQERARVTLSYRGSAFKRVAGPNLERLEALRGAQLQLVLESQVRSIEPQRVFLESPDGGRWLRNDQVFVFVGGELPTKFLEKIGIEMATYKGEPQRPPSRPANVPVGGRS